MSIPEPQPAPRPLPASLQETAGVALELHFPELRQGGLGLLCLRGDGIVAARARWRDELIDFFRADGDWHAILVAEMEALPRDYPLAVHVKLESGMLTFARQIRIVPGKFILEPIDMQGAAAGLIDSDIEAAEAAALDALTSPIGAQPLWDAGGFSLPLPSALTSPFGSYRALNGRVRTRHTGWDQQAATGTPVRAMAAGRVVFAGQLEIRGGYVLLDHGLGLYSGYAHFSALGAQAGQSVQAGQFIGASGSTGRSSAPHLHWELRLRGRWVEGLALLDMWLPPPTSP